LLKALNVSIRISNQIINRFVGSVACISFSNEIAAPLGSSENPLLQYCNRNVHTYQAIACSPRSHPARPAIPFMPALLWRIFDEEKFLAKNLPGYAAYLKKVKYRLVPYIW
jgi:hypothetical protein